MTDANGCSATSAPTAVTVNALPTPTITAGGPTTFCAGGSRHADRVERRVVSLVDRRDDAVDHRQRQPATTASPSRTRTAAARRRRRRASPSTRCRRRRSPPAARRRSAPAAGHADRVERRVVPLVDRRDDAVDHRRRLRQLQRHVTNANGCSATSAADERHRQSTSAADDHRRRPDDVLRGRLGHADRVARRVVSLVDRRDDAVDHRRRRPATTA